MKLPQIKFDWLNERLKKLGLKDEDQSKSKDRVVYINNAPLVDNLNPITKSNAIKTHKYNIFNFLPKNLFEQFRRVANLYFLINIIIIFIIPDPPTSPYTSIIPLAFVVIVTAVKQAYEDILRHYTDRKTNNKIVRVLKEGIFQEKRWKDIRCGDIVEVTIDSPLFPCDLLLLHSQTDDAICQITTANLDGETNLKQRSVPKCISGLDSPQKLSNFSAIVRCDKPNTHLYEFNGKIILNNREYPLTNDNLLLRGSCLKISPVIYGCAIYTGHDTKVMLNSKFKSNKISCIERKLNRFIFIFLALLAILTVFCFGLSFIYINIYETHWYIKYREPSYYLTNRSLYIFIVFVFYMNLLNYIVPLSMYVTIELQRFVGSKFIQWDLEMYNEATNQTAIANTSDLNEDLGQVEYLFSDKTGTLTQNEMTFKQFSVDDKIYEEKDGELFRVGTSSPIRYENDSKIMSLLELLSVCHTVQVNESSKERYQASSPDEMCFVDFCNRLNIVFEGDRKERNSSSKCREITFQSSKRKYEILQVLDFDSTRKRMSIIVKNMQNGKIILFCKGADSAIFKQCVSGDIQCAEAAIKIFAHSGWRTLALAYKELSQNDYNAIEQMITDAYNDIMDRNNRIAQAFDKIESNLVLIGSTAIEDKLQEDVADTLESLRLAGIKVWVLTGDKLETAINISQSCSHFSDEMQKLMLTGLNNSNDISEKLDEFLKRINKKDDYIYALVIDGETLLHIFKDKMEKKFCSVCLKCDAVLCCRLSPAQKASVVKLVKQSEGKPITAAIGDGANDVSMIQEAHIGIGIFGKEGNSAAKSSDFCFSKFKFLKRILLYHGYLYYTRISTMVNYFFYKNMTFLAPQLYYCFSNAFSSTSFYNSLILTCYNLILTSVPVLLYGLFEQRKSFKDITYHSYREISKNKYLTDLRFFMWNSNGIWHSLVIYFSVYIHFFNGSSLKPNGTLPGAAEMSGIVVFLVFLVVHIKLLFEWKYRSVITLICYCISLIGFTVICILPNSVIVPSALTSLTENQSLYWIFFEIFSSARVWLLILFVLITAFLPDISFIVLDNTREARNQYVRDLKIRQTRTYSVEAQNDAFNMDEIKSNSRSNPNQRATKPSSLIENKQKNLHFIAKNETVVTETKEGEIIYNTAL